MTDAANSDAATGCTAYSRLPVPPPSTPDAIFARDAFPDKRLFDVTTQHPAVSVPVKRTAPILKRLKDCLVKGTKNVYTDASGQDRRVIVLKLDTTKEEVQNILRQEDDDTDSINHELQWVDQFPVTRTYDDQSADEILRKLLPVEEIPSSFELVGTIAHVNLKEPCWPYKYWIGQVLLERTPVIKTVVNKVGTVDNVYRTFGMEVLAGDESEDWSIVKVHEHGSTFELDYRHVYWNSRLSHEHKRLVDLILEEQDTTEGRSVVVADLMAGVGPFAVPLTRPRKQRKARHNPIVYANDLNPKSFQYLKINAQANKCKKLLCYNQDARVFLHQLQKDVEVIDHVIMNLPASAPEFLDAFRGWSLSKLPTIHVHCFAPKTSLDHAETVERFERALGCSISKDDALDIHVVRNVSPSNNMLCASFPLPQQARSLSSIVLSAQASDPNDESNQEPDTKRAKVEKVNR